MNSGEFINNGDDILEEESRLSIVGMKWYVEILESEMRRHNWVIDMGREN